MIKDIVKPGDALEIHDKRDGKKFYVSRVENIIDENHILTSVPIAYGNLVKLPIGTVYSFLFFIKNGVMQYDAVITEYSKEDHLSFMKVELRSAGKRTQRRAYFRFTCLLPMKLCRIDEDEKLTDASYMGKSSSPELHDGIVKDISGGGIKFVTNLVLEAEDYIRCIISLNHDFVLTVGKLLPEVKKFPNSKFIYQYKAEFSSISEESRDRIVQYIFGEQRKLLRRGIGAE
jgi:c-di-GMP-binding flagellar brake protein YcgR